ncbi:hypothetical protein NQ166_12370 [Microbacterium sp. zg.Y1090]|uniref:hypothetical protein n=1 Tax=Microbacterium wangruii TaxID=3049073 RepID=UPI00214D9FE0|nr:MULTISPECIES: hypothetical protein [unclassified Microbacterium]MCR2819619.1 hypothetical protein [Microbacterium sp. zg.Y1090]WIM28135.1 hypothetical protein QNO26_13460 [Microbacterium sp. zg-Y1090]
MTTPGKRADEVFGVSQQVRDDSYVDRAGLDATVAKYLRRDVHISLRGPSKSGKSWLRQLAVPDAIVVQCRLDKTAEDLYKEALGALGINLVIRETKGGNFAGHVESSVTLGQSLILKVAGKLGLSYTRSEELQLEPVSQDVNDLRFVAELLNESGRRLVIEDVHYLSHEERRRLAYDLKTFWDFGVFVIIVGIWSQQSLIDLNPDLSTRVREFSLSWTQDDLLRIIDKGQSALNLSIDAQVKQKLVSHAYGNAGLLQALALGLLDEAGFDVSAPEVFEVSDANLFDSAAMALAESLNPLYQSFAKRTSAGIRTRQNSTGIYAHTMAVILDSDDDKLINGIHARTIYREAHAREKRIQQPNLKTILRHLDSLQIDQDGRGLVVTYDEGQEEVSVVDLQLLLYRKFSTVKWPWEEIVQETDGRDAYQADLLF